MNPVTTVFLDRDGTVNVKAPEGSYVQRPEDLVLLPGAAAAIRRLNAAGVRVVLVTNQRGIAAGRYSAADYQAVHAALLDALRSAGARLDAVYVCPHERDSCACRKPLPGLLLQAARELPDVDLGSSAVVGDAASDIAAGVAAGVRTTIRIGAGPPAPGRGDAVDHDAAVDHHEAVEHEPVPDAVVPHLAAAVDLILGIPAGRAAGAGGEEL